MVQINCTSDGQPEAGRMALIPICNNNMINNSSSNINSKNIGLTKMNSFSSRDSNAAPDVSLRQLSRRLQDFATARDWDQFHSPRNLLLALVGEMGELSEIFQWRGEVGRGLPGWSAKDKEHLGEELSDVLLYLVRLSDICGVDLGQAALKKIWKNGLKYPVEKCKASSKNRHT